MHVERQRYSIEKNAYIYVRSVRFWNSSVRKWGVRRGKRMTKKAPRELLIPQGFDGIQ